MRYLRCDEKILGAEDRHEKPELTNTYPLLDDQTSRQPAARARTEPGAARVQADHLADREQHRHQHAQEEHQAPARRAHEYEASSARRTALNMATGIKIKYQGHLEGLP